MLVITLCLIKPSREKKEIIEHSIIASKHENDTSFSFELKPIASSDLLNRKHNKYTSSSESNDAASGPQNVFLIVWLVVKKHGLYTIRAVPIKVPQK